MNPESPYQQPVQQSVQQPVYAPIPPPSYPPVNNGPKSSKKWIVFTIVFLLTTLGAGGVAAWAYMNYLDQKENVDSKVTSAVAAAVKKQQDVDAANFAEQEKQPMRQFAGPDDYGRLSFDYPKTWSIYVAKDATDGGQYEAYFNPVTVPPVNAKQRYALRVLIQEKDYDQVLKGFETLIKNGGLTSSTFKVDDQAGTRLDGNFTKDLKGSAVMFKIRDKTVTVQTDAETFKKDFDALIKTITFNK